MEKRFKVTVDGRAYDVTVEEVTETGNLYPSPGLSAASVTGRAPATAPAPAAPVASGGANDLASPLAGVIVDVLVQPGQDVAEGGKVMVIEAMKMKTQINAHKSGKVSSVNVAIGDGVDAGQSLMVIE